MRIVKLCLQTLEKRFYVWPSSKIFGAISFSQTRLYLNAAHPCERQLFLTSINVPPCIICHGIFSHQTLLYNHNMEKITNEWLSNLLNMVCILVHMEIRDPHRIQKELCKGNIEWSQYIDYCQGLRLNWCRFFSWTSSNYLM